MDHWKTQFQNMGALWIHDQNPRRPHALLTSGNHSNGFFNASLVTVDTSVLIHGCQTLLSQLGGEMHDNDQPLPEMVVGSALGAITIAYELARTLSVMTGFTEKIGDDDEGNRIMNLKRVPLEPGTTVLCCEDVLTTGTTTLGTFKAIEDMGGSLLPYLLVLVNRSGKTELAGRKILSLIEEEMPIWKPDECPLCAQGSEAIRPKGNWDKLTAEY